MKYFTLWKSEYFNLKSRSIKRDDIDWLTVVYYFEEEVL